MAIKSAATLKADNASNIGSATAPESITPTILANQIDDEIDSAYNKEDKIPVGFDAALRVVIPSRFAALLSNGDKLEKFFSVILKHIDDTTTIINNSNLEMPQGRSGMFFASEHATKKQYITNGNAGTIEIVVLDDFTPPNFDHGQVWSSFDYRNADASFSGKFYLSNLELELVTAPVSIDIIGHFEIQDESGTALATGDAFTIAKTDSPGQKYYPKDIETGVITVTQTTGKVRVVLVVTQGNSANHEIFKINTINFRNEDA